MSGESAIPRAGAARAPGIPRALLVAGPSGAGKSTFIRQMMARDLPHELQSELDAFVRSAPVVEITNKLRRRIEIEGADAVAGSLGAVEALIVHYDITSVHRAAMGGYSADPALQLVDFVKDLRIVSIQPDQNRLLAQFSGRAKMKQDAKRRTRLVWNTLVLTPLRRARALLSGRTLRMEDELYRSAEWVASCYHQWTEFLAQTASRRSSLKIHEIEPCSDLQRSQSFRSIRMAGGAA